MIYDRTLTDVENAKYVILNKMQKGITLTNDDFDKLHRGTCDTIMLNRIYTKMRELYLKLNDLYYKVDTIEYATYNYTNVFYYNQNTKLFDNLRKLRNAFFVYTTTPDIPNYIFGYKEANAIEKILVDIENMITDMKSRYRQCGTFQCGEANTN